MAIPISNDQVENSAVSYDYLLNSTWNNRGPSSYEFNDEENISNNIVSNNPNNASNSQYLSTQDTENIYDPHFIDDPELKTGKHRTVLNLPGFRVFPLQNI
jgi:hypothetical protein